MLFAPVPVRRKVPPAQCCTYSPASIEYGNDKDALERIQEFARTGKNAHKVFRTEKAGIAVMPLQSVMEYPTLIANGITTAAKKHQGSRSRKHIERCNEILDDIEKHYYSHGYL